MNLRSTAPVTYQSHPKVDQRVALITLIDYLSTIFTVKR